MINLEWLRTFRAVYRTKSLSKASELLSISQPTISQHLSNLEAHMGQKLFVRKSKGVLETDEGKMLNTLVSGAIESLEEVEDQVIKKKSRLKSPIKIGISEHLYKTMLCNEIMTLGEFVHVKFGNRQTLIRDVEEGRLHHAVIPEEADTFDIICHPLFDQYMVLVSTPDIDLKGVKKMIKNDIESAERLLTNQTWYAHDSSSSYIKLFWMKIFNKKRPSILPNYVIPNEYEVLSQLSKSSGLSVALKQNVLPFIKDGTLITWDLAEIKFRKMSLISSKKKADREITQRLYKMLKR